MDLNTLISLLFDLESKYRLQVKNKALCALRLATLREIESVQGEISLIRHRLQWYRVNELS
jgi:hypothetical protein